ncbi:uncharacterized protein LOC119445072 [Dermacentor silvarum]|uniref:uncharacterized protein LOC119445072 n=1 Tax=Dermacentor silvarum TaxID=543639 RepID=UPI002100817B|nr:uncharacterized protein LOC119445072 [Dermacentor silvarum]
MAATGVTGPQGEPAIVNGSLDTVIGSDLDGDPLWTARLLATRPDDLVKAYQDYLSVGCNVLTTCTLRASVPALQEHLSVSVSEAEDLIASSVRLARRSALDMPRRLGADDRTHKNKGARAYNLFCGDYGFFVVVMLSLQSIHTSTPKSLSQIVCTAACNSDASAVRVAGSVGPYGAYLYDGSEYNGSYADRLSADELRDWHRPRVRCLVRAGGCDLLAFETVPALREALALVRLLREFPGVRAWLSFSCQNERLTAKGESIADAVRACLAEDSAGQLAAIGVNCCQARRRIDARASFYRAALTNANNFLQHIGMLASSIAAHMVAPLLSGVWKAGRPPLVARPDAEFHEVGVFGQPPKDRKKLQSQVVEWYGAGVRFFGGCCGTGTDHMAAIVEALATVTEGAAKKVH